MWAPTTYISFGTFDPTLVQYTSSRGPGVVGSVLSARSLSSGWRIESVLTPVRVRVPRGRPPPTAAGIVGVAVAADGATAVGAGVAVGGGSNTYFNRSVAQP